MPPNTQPRSLPASAVAPAPRLAASGLRGHGPSAPASRALHVTSFAPTDVPSVLLVEPDERARSVIGAALARAGYEAVGVSSAEEAQRELSSARPLPAMVVTEVGLSGADGFAFSSQLRAELRTAHLPILLLARASEHFHRELATHAGADDYLAKPVYVNDIVSLVRLKSAPRALDGSFQLDTGTMPAPELLRALLAGVRSGRLEFTGASSKARIVFRQGRVVDAAFQGVSGEDALLRILLLCEGPYHVVFGPSLERAAFSLGLREFCTRIFPRALRWRELVGKSVPLTALLALDFAKLKEHLAELPDGINAVMRLFDGRRQVLTVVLEAPLEEVVTLEVITRLYALGVIAPLPAAAPVLTAPAFFEPAAEPDFRAVVPGDRGEDMERMLFGGTEPPALFDEAWQEMSVPRVSQQLSGTGQPAAPALPSMTPLAPEVLRQLEAFRIRPIVEPVEPKSPEEVNAFARGSSAREDGSLASALQEAAEPSGLPGERGAAANLDSALGEKEDDEGISRWGAARVEGYGDRRPRELRPAVVESAEASLPGAPAAVSAALAAAAGPTDWTEVEDDKAAVSAASRREAAPDARAVLSGTPGSHAADAPSWRESSEATSPRAPSRGADMSSATSWREAPEVGGAGATADVGSSPAEPVHALESAPPAKGEARALVAAVASAFPHSPGASAAPPPNAVILPSTYEDPEAGFFGEDSDEDSLTTPPPMDMAAESKGLARVLVGATAVALIAAAVVTALPIRLPKAPSAPVPASAPVAAAPVVQPAEAPASPTLEEAAEEGEAALAEALREGTTLYEQGRTAEAVKKLQEVVDADPTSSTGWLLLGLARFDASDAAGAEEAAREALDLNPKEGRALMLLASIYLYAGQRTKAEVELRRYLELEPQGKHAEEARQLLHAR